MAMPPHMSPHSQGFPPIRENFEDFPVREIREKRGFQSKSGEKFPN